MSRILEDNGEWRDDHEVWSEGVWRVRVCGDQCVWRVRVCGVRVCEDGVCGGEHEGV